MHACTYSYGRMAGSASLSVITSMLEHATFERRSDSHSYTGVDDGRSIVDAKMFVRLGKWLQRERSSLVGAQVP